MIAIESIYQTFISMKNEDFLMIIENGTFIENCAFIGNST